MRILLALASALLLVPSAAISADSPKKAPEDKVICKRVYDADTGSHFTSSKRVCRKASDWEQLERETGEAMRNIRDSNGVDPNNPVSGMGGSPQ